MRFLGIQTTLVAALAVAMPSPSVAQCRRAAQGGSARHESPWRDQERFNLWSKINSQENHSPLRGSSGSVSRLDLRAPAAARREYDEGYVLLMRRDFRKAVERLSNAVLLFPDFVAARSALGSAYMELGQMDQARDQFAHTVALDDHLPNSYLNLGCAQLSLRDYQGAEESLRKAYQIAPLDPELASALVYAQYMNQEYDAALDTVREVHSRKHPGAAIVHYYAAIAWYARNNPQNAESELQLFMQEDPRSPIATHAREMLPRVEQEAAAWLSAQNQSVAVVSDGSQFGSNDEHQSFPPSFTSQPQSATRDAVAESAHADFKALRAASSTQEAVSVPDIQSILLPKAQAVGPRDGDYILHADVNEVAVLFAATDHGKSVTDLTRADVEVRDDEKPPFAVTGFRNESELPLRLGLVIDTSESITGRFSFEQRAAADFVRQVLTGKNDLGFVIGVANSVLLVQDFTNDQQRIGRSIDQLAPAGGTALWDAVDFAAKHLATPEAGRVARMLVVISDGLDNSSAATLEEASEAAERGEVFVYTVSTSEDTGQDGSANVGNRALRAIAERTGGTAFVPSAFTGLSGMLDNLQQVIRSRYLISYKPLQFQNNGRYRTIDITAQKSGHRLRVFARRGYYADTHATKRAAF